MSKAMAHLLYAQRDCSELEPHYCRHVDAMTGEDLHSKSDIAAELAYRDRHIEALQDALQKASDHLSYCGYGDRWERECAREEGLEGTIEKALNFGGTP